MNSNGASPGTALVTGAGKRLGCAMALNLARRGFDVAVHYATSRTEAEGVEEEIRKFGRRALAFQADLLDEAATQELIPRVMDAFGGPVAVLVNNASIFERDSIDTATRASWDRHVESNLRAPFVLTQHVAAHAPEPIPDDASEPVAQALVVNMLDQRVLKPTPQYMTYTIAKMGLWAFTRTAAQALAPRLRVNAIGPGPTLRAEGQSESHFLRQRAGSILQRGGNVGDVEAALGYFLDAPAVTGQLLCVDGGQHLSWQTPDVIGPV